MALEASPCLPLQAANVAVLAKVPQRAVHALEAQVAPARQARQMVAHLQAAAALAMAARAAGMARVTEAEVAEALPHLIPPMVKLVVLPLTGRVPGAYQAAARAEMAQLLSNILIRQ